MMKLADYIGEDYTEQKAMNFLFHKMIGFLKMLQEEKGNLNNLDGPRMNYWFKELDHILEMNKEIDNMFSNPEEEIWELLREEIKKDCDAAVKEVLDKMNPVERLVIHNDVVMQGDKLVGGCIVIPDGVEEIGDKAFKSEWEIEQVIIPSSVFKIGKSAFEACESLESIVIPDSVTEIEEMCFLGCSALTRVTLSKGLKVISDYMFYDCCSLEDVMIPEGATEIGDSAFSYCKSLESIIIPESVAKIGEEAFSCCWSLKNITIPDGVAEIGNYAFDYCSSLKKVSLPKKVKLGINVFYRCHPKLKIEYRD